MPLQKKGAASFFAKKPNGFFENPKNPRKRKSLWKTWDNLRKQFLCSAAS